MTRRIGIYLIVLAFLLFIFFQQTSGSEASWRGDLIVFGLVCFVLGIFLLARTWPKANPSDRFKGVKHLLYKRPEKKK